jgi:glycosyltransferase involved in cell wall biosynthesis
MVTGRRFTLQARAFEIHRRDARPLLEAILPFAGRVITNSRYNHDLLTERARDVRWVHNGVDLDRFTPVPPPAGGPIRLLSVGRLVRKKGFVGLVEVVATLRGEGYDVVLEIIGGADRDLDADTPWRIEAARARLGLGDSVHLLGERPFDEVLAGLGRAHVVVLNCTVAPDGDQDVTPNVLLESMAMERPVVATDVGAVSELVEDGVTGIVVPPDDPARLADAIARLLADSALRARMGRAGRARAEARFDIDVNARTMAGFFDDRMEP